MELVDLFLNCHRCICLPSLANTQPAGAKVQLLVQLLVVVFYMTAAAAVAGSVTVG